MSGFFVQEEAADSDGNDATSEGVFVYATSLETFPMVGDLVRMQGDVVEYNDLTEFVLSGDVEVLGAGGSILYTELSMPFSTDTNLEAYEGMQITFTQSLLVNDVYNLGRYGQFNVGSERVMIPTNQYPAGTAEAIALAEQNALNTLLVDDASNSQNLDGIPFPVGGLTHANPLRLGDTVENLTGVMHYSFSEYQLLPVMDLSLIHI